MHLDDMSSTNKNVKSRFMHKATCAHTNGSCCAQFPALISSSGANTMLRSHRTEQLGEKSCSVPRQQRAHQMPERWGWTVGQEKIRCQGSKQHDGCGPKVGIFCMMLRWEIQRKPGQTFWMRRGAAMCLWVFTNACTLTYKHRIHFIQTTDAANWSTKALISIACQICDKRDTTF